MSVQNSNSERTILVHQRPQCPVLTPSKSKNVQLSIFRFGNCHTFGHFKKTKVVVFIEPFEEMSVCPEKRGLKIHQQDNSPPRKKFSTSNRAKKFSPHFANLKPATPTFGHFKNKQKSLNYNSLLFLSQKTSLIYIYYIFKILYIYIYK